MRTRVIQGHVANACAKTGLFLLFGIALSGCRQEPVVEPGGGSTDVLHAKYVDDPEGETVLGEERENPFTTRNMTRALSELRASGVEVPSNVYVRTTHHYVRYRPQTWEQYVQLHMDQEHIFFDHPLDREVETPGNHYHDPEISEDMPEYQYAALGEDFVLENGIPYDVLADLYLPELDPAIEDREFAEALISQAFVRLGMPEDEEEDGDAAAKASWYTPAGQVLIYDDRLNANIGLEGVLVTARRWFTVFWGRADHSGNYQVNGAFKRPCNYSLHFEAPGFNVREHVLFAIAYVDGPKQTGNWNTTIGAGSYNNYAGTVFRGAYFYHYKNIDGLLRPFNPNGQPTSYIAKNAVSSGSIGFSPAVVPLIFIWRQYAGGG
ncbi:MAG TPA: hypothetical protein VHL57_02060, partial [Flavobacteriales bacterium]|nr:hypothetical protein [Flavobacteriales bacterium]